MLKGVIFDHDGTLVDSERKHYGLWVDILAEFGIDFPEEVYKTHLAGVPTQFNARYLVDTYNLPLSADELFAKREIATNATLGKEACPLIPGAKQLVQWVHGRQLAMAIATGAATREVEPTLSQHGFAQYFPIVASRDHVDNAKPAPDVYQYALDKLGLQAKQCIAIEDSPTGLKSAIACGIDCIVVQNDYSRGHDFSGALAVFDRMDEAQNHLAKMLDV
ncbi:HAD family phosphatase [Gilvimarinus sp. SDUM040013]|uniref:HAD family phosphatase n=1 Tax=Gilvimarinus gilvus TaxID=3058038 RepID=A0ABU4RXG5_9GAMM|nr:HAD family phosphatase [Gilvimarinus sp. SDUM040013]MDO3388658.1 HAD family phosphatase [Gilvimarinus sp. SDUM040013]MDX6849553.1 HAD family phosphatase [Gilvimarinus sp. SDUM040013]